MWDGACRDNGLLPVDASVNPPTTTASTSPGTTALLGTTTTTVTSQAPTATSSSPGHAFSFIDTSPTDPPNSGYFARRCKDIMVFTNCFGPSIEGKGTVCAWSIEDM